MHKLPYVKGDGQTDRRTDRQTDRRTDGQTRSTQYPSVSRVIKTTGFSPVWNGGIENSGNTITGLEPDVRRELLAVGDD